MAPPTDDALDLCEECLKYRFRDRSHLVHALTHGSAKSDEEPSNERLEFLGDAILGMIVSTLIFAEVPQLDEGVMTKVRARTVSRPSLVAVAEEIELRRFIIVGKMFDQREAISESILGDAVEALIAAIYVDGGFDAAIDFVIRHFRPRLDEALHAPGTEDFKSRLGQWSQKALQLHPIYEVTSVDGPDHALVFEVRVLIDGEELASANGSTKKAAEQEAARQALVVLEQR